MSVEETAYWLDQWRRFAVGDCPHPDIPLETLQGGQHEPSTGNA